MTIDLQVCLVVSHRVIDSGCVRRALAVASGGRRAVPVSVVLVSASVRYMLISEYVCPVVNITIV